MDLKLYEFYVKNGQAFDIHELDDPTGELLDGLRANSKAHSAPDFSSYDGSVHYGFSSPASMREKLSARDLPDGTYQLSVKHQFFDIGAAAGHNYYGDRYFQTGPLPAVEMQSNKYKLEEAEAMKRYEAQLAREAEVKKMEEKLLGIIDSKEHTLAQTLRYHYSTEDVFAYAKAMEIPLDAEITPDSKMGRKSFYRVQGLDKVLVIEDCFDFHGGERYTKCYTDDEYFSSRRSFGRLAAAVAEETGVSWDVAAAFKADEEKTAKFAQYLNTVTGNELVLHELDCGIGRRKAAINILTGYEFADEVEAMGQKHSSVLADALTTAIERNNNVVDATDSLKHPLNALYNQVENGEYLDSFYEKGETLLMYSNISPSVDREEFLQDFVNFQYNKDQVIGWAIHDIREIATHADRNPPDFIIMRGIDEAQFPYVADEIYKEFGEFGTLLLVSEKGQVTFVAQDEMTESNCHQIFQDNCDENGRISEEGIIMIEVEMKYSLPEDALIIHQDSPDQSFEYELNGESVERTSQVIDNAAEVDVDDGLTL